MDWRSGFVVRASVPYALRSDRATRRGCSEMGERNGIALCSRHGSTEWSGLDESPPQSLARRSWFPYALTIDRATVRGQQTRGMTMIELNGSAVRANEAVRNVERHAPLQAILSALPAATMVPAGWVLEQIVGVGGASVTSHTETLSVQEFAMQRVPRRTPDWVREKCADGSIDGAFKDGGEWRIPRSALTQQIPRSRAGASGGTSKNSMPSPRVSGAPTHLRW